MAQKLVVTESLTNEMIEAGADLVRRLDASPIEIRACLWHFLPEPNVWRLIIASPEVAKYGPRKVYRKIQDVLSDIPEEGPSIGLTDISAVAHDNSLISLLRKAIKTGNGVSGIRFSRNVIDGQYIEDTYIYFIS